MLTALPVSSNHISVSLFFFLIPVIILNFTSFRIAFVKGLFLPEKVPFKTGRIHGFFNGNAVDDAEVVWRSHKKKSAKNYSLDRQTTSSQIGEITGVKRNCFLKNLRIVCRFLRMSFFYPCPGISPQRCLAHSLLERSSQGHIPFGRSFSFQFAPQLVVSEKGRKLTPSIINWELFCRLHERIFVNFL